MNSESVNFDLLFDADEYRSSGHGPFTFFAYPTTLAVANGLPPDEDACQFLGEVQKRGIDVTIWSTSPAENTTYFACRKDDIQRLFQVLQELEKPDFFGENFCYERTEELFRKANQ
ncbi:MAG: hypothetical protein COA78_18685 [Blastopirellula sp.]|nr:MAG: hypothetical protein COA78_18685 [Blastopirellula sp.]